MTDLLTFLTKWSPYIWLFGSVFGVMMSGALMFRVYEQRVVMKHFEGSQTETSKFWFRHGVWFLLMHTGFVLVGALAVLEARSEWANLTTIVVLLATPLILVYRSYDCLRLDRKLRVLNGVSKRDVS